MLKKCVILSLMLLLVGGLAMAWVRSQVQREQLEASALISEGTFQPEAYVDRYSRWYEWAPEQQNQLVLQLDEDRRNKTAEQLAGEQQARLRRDLDRLAAGEMSSGDIADFLYGDNWEQTVAQYKIQKEQEQIAQTAAAVCLSIGGVLFVGCLLIRIVEVIVRGFRVLAQRRRQDDNTESESTDLTDIMHEEESSLVAGPSSLEKSSCVMRAASREQQRKPALSEVEGTHDAPRKTQDADRELFVLPRDNREAPAKRRVLAMESHPDPGGVALLLSDEPTPEAPWSREKSSRDKERATQDAACKTQDAQRPRFTPRPKVAMLDIEQTAAQPDDTLAEQADDLQKQIAEFRQMAQSVQQANHEHAAPINSTLKELAQQVSAIREYAASQQGRVEKLQDGYDWTIIRTFCLRVIRCIDNIENRIGKLADGNGSATHLEEVKDELLFALESSGVEQFRPEINSQFRGQEKFAEAVKDKQATNKPDQAGRIAKVIRPGYRYVVDDDSYKVVRTAQVKLFG